MEPDGDAPVRADMLKQLQRRHDGTPPRVARTVVKVGGLAAWARLRDRADLARALASMAAARRAIALRRPTVADPRGDGWLDRLTAEVAALRAGAVRRQPSPSPPPPRHQSRLCDPSQTGDFAVALQPQK